AAMQTWIWEHNLRPMFEFTSILVGYDFDDADWDAITVGVADTEVEVQRWFEYPLKGQISLTLRVARDGGSNIVALETDGDADDVLEVRLETAAALMAHYRLLRREGQDGARSA